jgi:hypothetical protein
MPNAWHTSTRQSTLASGSTFVSHALSRLKESSGSSSSRNTTSLPDRNLQRDSTSITNSVSTVWTPGIKLRRLKDTMWVRETLEDLTAAEFALSVESSNDSNDDPKKSKKLKKRAVDYEKLVSQLDQRISNLGCDLDGGGLNDFRPSDSGMATLTYTEKQRVTLLERLVHTRMSSYDPFCR